MVVGSSLFVMSQPGPASLLSLKGRVANSARDNGVPGTIVAAEAAYAARQAQVRLPHAGVHDWGTRATAVSLVAATGPATAAGAAARRASPAAAIAAKSPYPALSLLILLCVLSASAAAGPLADITTAPDDGPPTLPRCVHGDRSPRP